MFLPLSHEPPSWRTGGPGTRLALNGLRGPISGKKGRSAYIFSGCEIWPYTRIFSAEYQRRALTPKRRGLMIRHRCKIMRVRGYMKY